MNVETVLKLDSFKPRPYQREAIVAVEEKGYKKLLLNFQERIFLVISSVTWLKSQTFCFCFYLQKILIYFLIYKKFTNWNNI